MVEFVNIATLKLFYFKSRPKYVFVVFSLYLRIPGAQQQLNARAKPCMLYLVVLVCKICPLCSIVDLFCPVLCGSLLCGSTCYYLRILLIKALFTEASELAADGANSQQLMNI